VCIVFNILRNILPALEYLNIIVGIEQSWNTNYILSISECISISLLLYADVV